MSLLVDLLKLTWLFVTEASPLWWGLVLVPLWWWSLMVRLSAQS